MSYPRFGRNMELSKRSFKVKFREKEIDNAILINCDLEILSDDLKSLSSHSLIKFLWTVSLDNALLYRTLNQNDTLRLEINQVTAGDIKLKGYFICDQSFDYNIQNELDVFYNGVYSYPKGYIISDIAEYKIPVSMINQNNKVNTFNLKLDADCQYKLELAFDKDLIRVITNNEKLKEQIIKTYKHKKTRALNFQLFGSQIMIAALQHIGEILDKGEESIDEYAWVESILNIFSLKLEDEDQMKRLTEKEVCYKLFHNYMEQYNIESAYNELDELLIL